jgi:hypothetical protein
MDLAEAVGLPRTKTSQRKLQFIIRDLRRHNKPILLTCEKPYGYFWPSNPDEGQICLASMKSRICEDAYTRRDIKVALGLYFANAKQLELL